jgi:hypothetical protein
LGNFALTPAVFIWKFSGDDWKTERPGFGPASYRLAETFSLKRVTVLTAATHSPLMRILFKKKVRQCKKTCKFVPKFLANAFLAGGIRSPNPYLRRGSAV